MVMILVEAGGNCGGGGEVVVEGDVAEVLLSVGWDAPEVFLEDGKEECKERVEGEVSYNFGCLAELFTEVAEEVVESVITLLNGEWFADEVGERVGSVGEVGFGLLSVDSGKDWMEGGGAVVV